MESENEYQDIHRPYRYHGILLTIWCPIHNDVKLQVQIVLQASENLLVFLLLWSEALFQEINLYHCKCHEQHLKN